MSSFEGIEGIRYTYHYDQVLDTFTLTPETDKETHLSDDNAYFWLGDDSEFIAFDNDTPGKIEMITHNGKNKRAIKMLAGTILTAMYPLVCKSFRKGTKIYGELERTRTLIVPDTVNRHFGRLALHANAENTLEEVVEFYELLKNRDVPIFGDGGGEAPLPSAG